MNFIYVFIGGGLGAISRYLITLLIDSTKFPLATLICNLIGCFCIGIAMNYASNSFIKSFVIIGFIGGFTTFASFAFEIIQHINKNQFTITLLYMLLSIILGLIFVVLGFKSMFFLHKPQ